MSQFQPLLKGNVDNRDELISALEDKVSALESENAGLRVELARTKGVNAKAVAALRHEVEPMYRALQALFGELENFEVSTPTASVPVSAKSSALWESWKRDLGGKQAEFIDALLEYGEMNVEQLRVAAKCAKQTVYETVHKLHKLGLLNKNGGKYSLKEL